MASHLFRRGCGAAALAILLWPAAGATQAPSEAGTPRAIVPEIGHDFGPVEPGGRLQHTFSIRNAGDAPLAIQRVDVPEPGMRSRFTSLVPPGDTGRVTIEWVADRPHGNLDAQVVVHTDDPKRPRVALTLTGVVSRSIEIQPSSDLHVSLYRDQTVERRISIVNTEERPLEITAVKPLDGHVTADLRVVEPGRRFELLVRVPSGLACGRHLETIEIDTDHPRLTHLRVAVNLFVKDDLFANPERIDFGALTLREATTPSSLGLHSHSTTLRKRAGMFTIVGLTTDVPGLRVNRSPAGSSNSFGLTMTLDPKTVQSGSLKGSVRIQTDDKDFPIIVLPVSGEIR